MKTVCGDGMCAGCKACVDVCVKNAIEIRDDVRFYNAFIDERRCIGCNACRSICPQVHPAEKVEPLFWQQGWAGDWDREKSSSGGIGYALARSFVESGGVVAACIFRDGKFIFEMFDAVTGLDVIRGSKYVKSNPEGIYKHVRALLLQGNAVMFVGLPCQVSAMRNFVGARWQEKLLTVDLICHGSPSPKILMDYLDECGVDLRTIGDISFRKNNKYGLATDGKLVSLPFNTDHYTKAFLRGICYTENCYQCDYASWNRVADITLGDSWGSVLPRKECDKGISLVLCQTEKGCALVERAGLVLFNVDKDRAISANHQLEQPSQKGREYDIFMQQYLRGGSVKNAVRKCFPKEYFKQKAKTLLYYMRLYGRNEKMC